MHHKPQTTLARDLESFGASGGLGQLFHMEVGSPSWLPDGSLQALRLSKGLALLKETVWNLLGPESCFEHTQPCPGHGLGLSCMGPCCLREWCVPWRFAWGQPPA